MITASFIKSNGKFCNFRIHGHSGYAEEGSDIVCAAVSAMAMLTVNNITESFGVPAKVVTDEEGPVIDFKLVDIDERACALIAGLWRELAALANDYPKNIRVTVK
ncbi:MAG: ribosomal-processing cysteine protease Prp [Clostridia bacterium]|nr:ribosomal-processing cysteine protease Prp [Clostridia bacterium]